VRLKHPETYALYEHGIIWPVEESDCFRVLKASSNQPTPTTILIITSSDSE